jgi:nitrite reductase/ring-hydroxylating ferredoxin subunit
MKDPSMAEESTPGEYDFNLCSLEDLQQKTTLRFEFAHPKMGQHEIGLFWDGESAFALDNYCPHEFGMLTHGMIEPGKVICPLHAAVFDLNTGECLDKYTYDTVAYETTVVDGRVWVNAPGEKRHIQD